MELLTAGDRVMRWPDELWPEYIGALALGFAAPSQCHVYFREPV